MMPEAVLAAPLIVAAVLISGAVAKLRHPDTLDGWQQLGVPEALRRRWLLLLHPYGELLLAVALISLGGVVGTVVAAAAVVLFGAYLALIVRSRRQGPDAACSCFGRSRRITPVTVARNVWFLALALISAGVIWATPILGGVLASLGDGWAWVPGLAAAGLTAALSLWEPDIPTAVETGIPVVPGSAASAATGDPGEYVRGRTPAVPVTLASGVTVNLRDLAARGPVLLLAVTDNCGSCLPAIEAMPRWRALLPEVSVRFLLSKPPGESGLTEQAGQQSIHDPERLVRASIADWPTPTALLIGADGYLAGGPVSGYDAIDEFIADVYEVLHGERPRSTPGA